MSLLEDIEAFFAGRNKWPGDLDTEVDNATLFRDDIVDTSRWGIIHDAVYLRKTLHTTRPELLFWDEYVMVRYTEPATEMQDWEDFNAPEIFLVEAYEETITRFRKKP